jgi:transposase
MTAHPSSASSYQLFVGIDIAAQTAKAAWMVPEQAVSRAITIEQTPQGFASLQRQVLAIGHAAASTLVVMEATGSYWVNLALSLTQAGFAVSVINPAQSHHFARALLKRGKTDAIDAQTLAQLAAVLQPAPWSPPPPVYTELFQRLTQRASLLEMRQHVRNQLHALQHLPHIVPVVRARRSSLIETLNEQIVQVEEEIEAVIALDETWAASAERLLTIPGIGLLTAAWLLVTTLNFTICQSADELTSYAGLAPHPYQSGSSVRGRPRIGHTGNSRLRSVLYLATLTAARYNPVIQPFYDRLRAAGKPMKVARCAAARKLLHLAFAVVSKKEEFDPTSSTKPRTAPAQQMSA